MLFSQNCSISFSVLKNKEDKSSSRLPTLQLHSISLVVVSQIEFPKILRSRCVAHRYEGGTYRPQADVLVNFDLEISYLPQRSFPPFILLQRNFQPRKKHLLFTCTAKCDTWAPVLVRKRRANQPITRLGPTKEKDGPRMKRRSYLSRKRFIANKH